MLGIAPARLVLFDELNRAFAEGSAFGEREPLRPPLSRLSIERVYAIMPLLAMLQRLRARLAEPDLGERTQAHVAALSVELKPEDPRLRALGRNAKIEPAAVVQHRRPLRLLDLDRREFAGMRHCPAL